MCWWVLLVALGLAGRGPTMATLQRLAPLARAYVQANKGSMRAPERYCERGPALGTSSVGQIAADQLPAGARGAMDDLLCDSRGREDTPNSCP
jgi:hypothetical protein